MLGDVVIADYVEYCEFWKLLPGRHSPRRLVHDQPSVYLRETFAEPLRQTGAWITPLVAVRPPQETADLISLPIEGSMPQRFWSRFTRPLAASPSVPTSAPPPPKTIMGTVLSGEKVWGDPSAEDQIRILRYYDKAVALEMEATGVARGVMGARTGVNYNPLYLVIRGISDLVNCSGNEHMRRTWTPYAAEAAAAFAYFVASDYLAVPRVI
jgi:hypothetical protein